MRLELLHLTRRFAGTARAAVQDLTFAVEPGERLTLVGPSGSGKTTTLRLIAGLERPDAGEVRGDGQSWNALPPEQRPVSLVFQNGALFPHLTVAENLTLGLRLKKTAPMEITRRLAPVVEMLHLTPLLERHPEELSGGERQRTALGRALMRQPRLLLLDEPLAGVDAPLRRELRLELVRLCRRLKQTVVWVTHDQEEALAAGERLAVLKEGLLQQVGAPSEVYRAPVNRFVATFLGSPAMNLIPVRWTTEQGRPALESPLGRLYPPPEIIARLGPAASAAPALELGIRPEALLPVCRSEGHYFLEAVEQTGGQSFWHLQGEGHSLICLAPKPGLTPPPDQPLQLAWNWADICWFDAVSGRTLHPLPR